MSDDNLFPHQRELIEHARKLGQLDATIAKQSIDRLANGARLFELHDETAILLGKIRDHAELRLFDL